jgi:hypothetical protein
VEIEKKNQFSMERETTAARNLRFDSQYGRGQSGYSDLPFRPTSAKLINNKFCIVILIIKTNEMHYFSTLFGKELCMFRTDLLSIIRSLNTVFTAIDICHTGYVESLLADRQH